MPGRRRGWAAHHQNADGSQHSPLSSALLEVVLLTLIDKQAQHGYTLLMSLPLFGIHTIHPSVVYRILREMETLGWIQSDWDAAETQGPPRRIYTTTPAGKAALKNWQVELEKTQKTIAELLTHQMEQKG